MFFCNRIMFYFDINLLFATFIIVYFFMVNQTTHITFYFTKIVQQKLKYFDSFNIDYIVMCILIIIVLL